MDKIALLRTEQAFPFVDYMVSHDMPAEKYLADAKLPRSLLQHADGLIVEEHLWRLLDIVSESEGLHDFGLRVGLDIDIHQQLQGMIPRLLAQPTLLAMLQAFCLMVSEESSDAQFWLEPSERSDRHWFCRGGVPGILVGEHDAELYTLMFMIKLVQLITGEQWYPASIRLKTDDIHGLDSSEYFRTSEIDLSQPMTAIEIPSYIVNKHFFAELSKAENTDQLNVPLECHPIPTKLFSESLREVLTLYLSNESIELELAAELIGVSPRTLQRKLSKESTTYAKLIDVIRFNSAIPLLKESNSKLIDIAFDLGYSDPAHFSRAFKRWSGMTPREYRRSLASA